MFAAARRRLAIRYLVLFIVVLVGFSAIFVVALAVVLQPAFDIAPEVSNDEAARRAYARTLQAIILALVVADGLVLAVVGAAGYYLADRTLRPIRDAHDRQRRFVADASHEMRTPIAAIRSTAEAAQLSGSGEEQVVALGSIVESAERLSRLTDDLLVLAQSERGLGALRDGTVDLSVVAAEAVDQIRGAATDAPAVSVVLGNDLIVLGDPVEIGRIIVNLVDNAIRYGDAPIRLRTLERDGRAVVEIADSGPGIADADRQRIFEPFFRVHADTSAPSGAGLGLAIAAGLARHHGGRLTVDSEPGRGSTFRLELPRFR